MPLEKILLNEPLFLHGGSDFDQLGEGARALCESLNMKFSFDQALRFPYEENSDILEDPVISDILIDPTTNKAFGIYTPSALSTTIGPGHMRLALTATATILLKRLMYPHWFQDRSLVDFKFPDTPIRADFNPDCPLITHVKWASNWNKYSKSGCIPEINSDVRIHARVFAPCRKEDKQLFSGHLKAKLEFSG